MTTRSAYDINSKRRWF